MAATKRFMNWTGVTFTPQNGSPTPITGVTSIQIDSGGSLIKFSGDGDRYSTTVVNDFNDPTVTVHSADLAAVRAFPVGTVGTFSATHNDAKNGVGTGAITYTLSNAVIASNPIHGAHRQFGQGTLTLTATSPDGMTNPLSTSIAS
jgi:hypothetical protein